MKTAFLHYMTNKMSGPAITIEKDVDILVKATADSQRSQDGECNSGMLPITNSQLAIDIQQSGQTIAELLKNLLNISDDEIEKEERL